jgi:hypothetical protein
VRFVYLRISSGGNCDGIPGPSGAPIKIPCSCPPSRDAFIDSLNANVNAGHAVHNPSVALSFPTGSGSGDEVARIQASIITLQNLNGPGVGCPAASTTFSAQLAAAIRVCVHVCTHIMKWANYSCIGITTRALKLELPSMSGWVCVGKLYLLFISMVGTCSVVRTFRNEMSSARRIRIRSFENVVAYELRAIDAF